MDCNNNSNINVYLFCIKMSKHVLINIQIKKKESNYWKRIQEFLIKIFGLPDPPENSQNLTRNISSQFDLQQNKIAVNPNPAGVQGGSG